MFIFSKNSDNSEVTSDNLSTVSSVPSEGDGSTLGLVAEVPQDSDLELPPEEQSLPPEIVEDVPEVQKEVYYMAILKTTKGDITIELNRDQTPKTVQNFVKLSRDGFYDDTIFHRVMEGFMIQGGDPEGTGRGGPGYKFDDEPFTGEYTRGTVAMANSGPNTNGSQFFIMHEDTQLRKEYVIFGKVISGMEAVDLIATDEVELSSSGEMSRPVNPSKILSVEILESQ